GCALTRHFSRLGIYALNNAEAITRSRDKLSTLQALQAADIPIPTTAFANSPADVEDLIAMVGGPPLLVKMLDGGKPHESLLARSEDEAQNCIRQAESRHANMLVQKYITEAQGKCLRCVVVDGKVVSAVELSGEPGQPAKAARQTSLPRPSDEEKQLALRATKALHLKVAGVDILRAASGPLVLGLTAVPRLEEVENVTNKDIAGKLVAAVEKAL